MFLLAQRSQQSNELQLGFIGPLTMVTGIEVRFKNKLDLIY